VFRAEWHFLKRNPFAGNNLKNDGLLSRLTRRIGQVLEDRADADGLFKGRRVLLVDGTTVSMPDTGENQRAFPQNRAQEPGLGFPIARLVAVISLDTGSRA
jgi:hypothetical protein